jgi:hypothetical protein
MKRFALAALLFAGCSPTTFTLTPASAKGYVSKPSNCPIEILTAPPTGNYEEVATLEYYNGKEPKTVDAFKKAVHERACQAGGDAVIAIANEKGQYMKGSVIHYLGDMATGIKPISDVPTPQQSDTEQPH